MSFPQSEWGRFLRENYGTLMLFAVLVLLLGTYVLRRILPPTHDPAALVIEQVEFLNSCFNMVLGALIATLANKRGVSTPAE